MLAVAITMDVDGNVPASLPGTADLTFLANALLVRDHGDLVPCARGQRLTLCNHILCQFEAAMQPSIASRAAQKP